MILLLVMVVCGGSNTAIRRHMDIAVNVPIEQQVGDNRLQSLVDSQSHLLTPPESHPIREKVRVGYNSQTSPHHLTHIKAVQAKIDYCVFSGNAPYLDPLFYAIMRRVKLIRLYNCSRKHTT